jgi:hypothetical protein
MRSNRCSCQCLNTADTQFSLLISYCQSKVLF